MVDLILVTHIWHTLVFIVIAFWVMVKVLEIIMQ